MCNLVPGQKKMPFVIYTLIRSDTLSKETSSTTQIMFCFQSRFFRFFFLQLYESLWIEKFFFVAVILLWISVSVNKRIIQQYFEYAAVAVYFG